MRQAGLKPKSHSSGVYWTRAHSNSSKTVDSEEVGIISKFLFWTLLYPVVYVYTWIANRIS